MTSIHLFFFNATSTTEIYTLSLHDALPISSPIANPDHRLARQPDCGRAVPVGMVKHLLDYRQDRKSTRLNSSHSQISYAVFCLKKKITSPKQSWHCNVHLLHGLDHPSAHFV